MQESLKVDKLQQMLLNQWSQYVGGAITVFRKCLTYKEQAHFSHCLQRGTTSFCLTGRSTLLSKEKACFPLTTHFLRSNLVPPPRAPLLLRSLRKSFCTDYPLLSTSTLFPASPDSLTLTSLVGSKLRPSQQARRLTSMGIFF